MAKSSPWPLFAASQSGSPRSVGFSPAGNRLATIDQDGLFHLWDTQTGRQIGQPFNDPDAGSCCIFFSDNGAFVATAGRSLRIWDAATGEQLLKIGIPIDVYDGQFSPDGTRLVAFGSDNLASLWDIQTGNPLPLPEVETQVAFFSPDSERLLLSDLYTGSLRLFDAERGEEIPLKDAEDASGDDIEFGGNLLVFSDYENHQLRESRTGQALHPFGEGVMLQQVDFSPDGSKLAVISEDGRADVLNTETGEVLQELQEHNIKGAWFSNTGEYLVVRASTGDARLLHAEYLQEMNKLGQIKDLRPDFDAADERLLFVTEEGSATLLDIASGHFVAVNGGTDTAQFSADGSRILTHTVGDWVQVLDSRSNQILFEQNKVPYPRSLDFSPDGRYLQYDNKIWSIDTGLEMFSNADPGGLQFSADGRLATGGGIVWDTTTVRNRLRFGTASNYSMILFNKDSNRIVTVDSRSSLADAVSGVWKGDTGEPVFLLGQANIAQDSLDGSTVGPVVLAQRAGGATWGILWNILTGKSIDISLYLGSIHPL